MTTPVLQKPKKKLLITSDSFLPRWDGVSRFLSEIIPKLKEDYDITVIAPAFPGKVPVFRGVHIFRLPLLQIRFGDIYFTRPYFRQIKKIVKNHDIIFNQTIGPIGIAAIRAGKRYKKPTISYIHSIEWELASKSIAKYKRIITSGVKFMTRYLYKKCTLLLIPTEEVGDLFEKEGIMTKKKWVPLGVDISRFMPPISKDKAKRTVGIVPTFKVVGYSGRIGKEKDVPTLYEAFKKLQKTLTDIKLLIVGGGSIEGMTADKNVILAGQQDNVIPYLQAMDIYVLPSLTETTSLSTMEAMACGVPPVCTPVGKVKEYIKNGLNGYLFPRKNVDALATRLKKLLADGELRKRMGTRARKTIISQYRWHDTVKLIKKALESELSP